MKFPLPALATTAALALAACSKSEPPVPAAAPAPQAAAPAAPAAAPQARNAGKILQLQHGGGYTYAEVDLGGGRSVWVAGAALQAQPGDTVQWQDHAVMTNFSAKSIGRTFEQILFVGAWGVAGGGMAQVAPHGTPPAGAAHPPMPRPAAAAGGGNQGVVKSAATAAGYTYLEVDQGGAVVWLAVPETAVKAGDKVSWADGPVMQNFNAKSLNRTFERIVFAAGVTPAQ